MAGSQGTTMVVLALACCCLLCVGGLGGFYMFYQPFRDWADKTLGIKAADSPPVDPPVVDDSAGSDVVAPYADTPVDTPPVTPPVTAKPTQWHCPSPLVWHKARSTRCWNPSTSKYVAMTPGTPPPKTQPPKTQPPKTQPPTAQPKCTLPKVWSKHLTSCVDLPPIIKDEWLCPKGYTHVGGKPAGGKECKNRAGAYSSPLRTVTGWICLGGKHNGGLPGNECTVRGKTTGAARWGCPYDRLFNATSGRCCVGNKLTGCTAPIQVA